MQPLLQELTCIVQKKMKQLAVDVSPPDFLNDRRMDERTDGQTDRQTLTDVYTTHSSVFMWIFMCIIHVCHMCGATYII